MKTAFCTFIYSKYYKYIPYYIYSIGQSYPDSDIIILYDGILPKKYKHYVENSHNTILKESFTKGHNWVKELKHRGAKYQSIRHILMLDVFFNYDYIYFGDVDILVLKEAYNLFQFHRDQCAKTQLPFSNKVRPSVAHENIPSKRLTGLHFVEVKPYYTALKPVIEKFLSDSTYRNQLLKDTERNEHVLYNLCKAAFNFDAEKLLHNLRPWHGFHLGLVRGKNYLNIETVKQNSSLDLQLLKAELNRLNSNGEINKLLMKYYCFQVYQTYLYLGLDLAYSVHLKYKFMEAKRKLITKLKYR
ncbi:hypothetical protein [uncultured Winogradskyella sp.]|uniref:hypothetical protein n=1 Tax=uncultured Winogradskyella sp. TaxID=395353 RepID=UPI00262F0009|nr:hypothetical protein [uncultured Winogradskyella sp.]